MGEGRRDGSRIFNTSLKKGEILTFKHTCQVKTPVNEIAIRVRYSETDQMGLLHHAQYLVYFELGRIELLRSRGLSYRELEQQGYLLVVVEARCRYHRPARFDDVLRLRTAVVRATAARIEHRYELWRDSELLAEGETTLACVNRAGKPQRIPTALRAAEES